MGQATCPSRLGPLSLLLRACSCQSGAWSLGTRASKGSKVGNLPVAQIVYWCIGVLVWFLVVPLVFPVKLRKLYLKKSATGF